MTITDRIKAAYRAFLDIKDPPPPPQELPEADWVPECIEEIETFIREQCATRGPFTFQEDHVPGRAEFTVRVDALAKKVTDLADKRVKDKGGLSSGSDPNLAYADHVSQVLFAWHVFIITAKAKATHRYSAENCEYMQYLSDQAIPLFRGIHAAAVKHAATYDVDNPKWLEAIGRYVDRLYNQLDILDKDQRWTKVREARAAQADRKLEAFVAKLKAV
jgi:hypothetical protein